MDLLSDRILFVFILKKWSLRYEALQEGCAWKKAALKFWNPYSPNKVSERTDEHITGNSKEKSRSFIGFFFENVTEKQAIGP